MDDTKRIKDIQERCEKATKGPWHWGEILNKDDDRTFIAHSREDIPWLLAQLTASRREAEEMRFALRRIHIVRAGDPYLMEVVEKALSAKAGG